MKKYLYIDAVRGIAIFLVLILHGYVLYGAGYYEPHVERFLQSGQYGVQLFYIASAYTLFSSLADRRDSRPILHYAIRRFFRIAPLFYLTIVYYLWQNGVDSFSTGNIVAHFLFVHGVRLEWINTLVPGGWSVAVEMMFYCLVPLLFNKINSLNKAVLFTTITLIISVCLTRYLEKPAIPSNFAWLEFLYYWFPNQLPVFGIGFVLYFLVKNDSLYVNPITLLIATGLFIVLSMFGLFPAHVLYSIGFLGLIYALSVRNYPLLVNAFTVFLGRISFSLYLSHFVVLYWMNRFGLIVFSDNGHVSYAIRFGIMLFISTLVSYLLYRTIELPFQHLGKKLIRRIGQKEKYVYVSELGEVVV